MNKEQLKALRTAHELIKTALGPMPGGGGPNADEREPFPKDKYDKEIDEYDQRRSVIREGDYYVADVSAYHEYRVMRISDQSWRASLGYNGSVMFQCESLEESATVLDLLQKMPSSKVRG